MSNEEQDVVVGRLVREHAELKKSIAANLEEAKRFGKAYYAAAQYLSSENPSSPGLRHGANFDPLRVVPDTTAVQNICETVLSAIQRRKEVVRALKDMGVDPKD